MDFRNLCSKIDVDAIRAKFPPLPEVMTQIKLPKSMSKLKSRKIFRMSREDVSRSSSKRRSSSIDDIAKQQQNPLGPPFSIPIPPTPSDFVNHTPERISTISSLVDRSGGGKGRSLGRGATMKKRHAFEDQDEENFYRSAGGIDDYCPSPEHMPATQRSYSTRPMSPPRKTTGLSPTRRTASEQNVKMSFKEKCQKGYKDASEFRLKHVFAKKTVVRQDTIQVTEYVRRFEEERRQEESEEEREARELEENYDFNFRTSRRKSDESFGVSTPRDSPQRQQQPHLARLPTSNPKKTLSEQSGDESGMELTPPPRRPGIAATRFSRVRKDPLRMSLDEDDGIKSPPKNQKSEEEEEEEEGDDNDIELDEVEVDKPPMPLHPIESALYNKINKQREEEEAEHLRKKEKLQKSRSIKKRLGTFKSVSQEGSLASNSPLKKRRAPLSPQESEEKSKSPKAEGGGLIKQNFKRLQKSIKLPNMSSSRGAESEGEADAESGKSKPSKTQQFAERLKRFRSVDNVDKQTDNEDGGGGEGTKTPGSPLQKLTHKLQDWKKSFKRKPSENTDDEMATNSPQKKEKPVGTLIRRLQHIRNRKQASTDDPDDDEEGGHSYRESFKSRAKLQLEKGMAAAQHMPQLTMEKLKESKKLFRKKQEKDKDKDKDKDKKKDKAGAAAAMKSNESGVSDLEESDEEEENNDGKMRMARKKKSKDNKEKATTRHYYSSDDEEEDDEAGAAGGGEDEKSTKITLEPYQQNVMVPLSRAAWTAKPILTDSGDDLDEEDDVLPRVLIHQDNTEGFESTLIIAVKCPISRSPTRSPAYIEELPPDYEDSPKASSPMDSPKPSTPETRANLAEFQTPLPRRGERRASKDSMLSSGSRSHHSRKQSIDSSSEDSWMKDVPRDTSNVIGLDRVYESEEPWKIHNGPKMDEKLYKTKSIDIFEKHKQQGGGMALHIFEDFDDELKNTPVVKISKEEEDREWDEGKQEGGSKNQNEPDESGEEMDQPDDDNSSRITKILRQPEVPKTEKEEEAVKKKEEDLEKSKFGNKLYGNSRESLNGNMERNAPQTDSGAVEDNEDSSEEDDDNDDDDPEEEESDEDRPPSHKPSPPPQEPTTPPPPVPQRQPSIRLSCNIPRQPPPPLPETGKSEEEEEDEEGVTSPPPPLPQTKPPLPPNRPRVAAPPKIPERTPSMNRVSRPLVKTASLRLAYSEQVNPEDVGKVNKLISKFEPQRRPRIIARRGYSSQESSQDYSDDEEGEEGETESEVEKPRSRNMSLDRTPTNKPKLQKSFSIETPDSEQEMKVNNKKEESSSSRMQRRAPEPPTAGKRNEENSSNNNNNNLRDLEKLQDLHITETKHPSTNNNNNNPEIVIQRGPPPLPPLPIIITTSQASPVKNSTTKRNNSTLSQYDTNSNCSQPNSEYGSPMAYPSSLMGSSTEVTPTSNRKETEFLSTTQQQYRSQRRSMARDDEHFYSFDSDEENSYYSISSTGSNRYVVEL
uniref:Uncharacterized protein n=1 Tax=Musca domestica TaxID=7370 RepID=A0A1I8MMH3_MUSDO